MDKKIVLLTEAMKEKNDVRTNNRIVAVRYVLLGHTTADAAQIFDVSVRSVQMWMDRFDRNGIDGLRDAPRPERRQDVPHYSIIEMAVHLHEEGMLTPSALRALVHEKTGRTYSLCHLRRILRRAGFSIKRSVTAYSSAADAVTVKKWQKNTKRTIARAEEDGFIVVVQDEAIFVRNGSNGSRLWSPVNEPIVVYRSGGRQRTVVYGVIAGDGTRLVRQYDKFDSETFVRYLEEIRRKWGRTLVILDNASQHRSRLVKEYLARHGGEIRLHYLPTATPALSAVEAMWKDAKYAIIVASYYGTIGELKEAVTGYFRTCRRHLDIFKYLGRSIYAKC